MAELSDEFTAGLVIGAGCVAHALAGIGEQALSLSLYHARQDIVAGFANLGPDIATAIADAFVTAVSTSKTEIEAAKRGAL